MGKTGTLNHTHRYFRREDGRWACLRDGCTHYMPKNMSPAPVGSNSICWSCEEEFMLTPINMKESKPTCDTCSEKEDSINAWLDSKTKNVEPVTGLDAFKTPYQKLLDRAKKNEAEMKEKNQIEVIEPDDE